MLKKIIIAIVILFITFTGYVLSLKGNIVARHLFENKYSETSDGVAKEIARIENKIYTQEEIDIHNQFIKTGENFQDDDLTPKTKINDNFVIDFDSMDNDQFYELFKNNIKKEKAKDFIDGDVIKYVEPRNVHAHFLYYQWFNDGIDLIYADFLKQIRNGKEVYTEFSALHENKIRHMAGSNEFIHALNFLSLLEKDLEFVKYVKEKHNVTLPIRELKKGEYELKNVINSEMESGFSLIKNDLNELVFLQPDIRYMQDVMYKRQKTIEETLATDINTYIDVNNEDFDFNDSVGYIEEYGSPVAYILLDMRPVNQKFRDDFYKHNESVKAFLKE